MLRKFIIGGGKYLRKQVYNIGFLYSIYYRYSLSRRIVLDTTFIENMRRYRVENIDGCLDNYYKKYCRIRFMTGATQEEFFLLDFYHKTQKQIQGYMTDYILHQNLWNMDAGAVKDESEFEDKKVLYKLLPELFGRQLISVSKESNYEDFEKFVTNASKIILKPNYACMGRGIFATTINNVAA